MKAKYKAKLVPARHAHFSGNDEWRVPATPEAYDAQVEAMTKAVYNHPDWLELGAPRTSEAKRQAQIMLAAIGIHRPAARK